eukprot:CAMPEP_0184861432 /NCGR_PEP_ID=MMETSP0580-20130426/6119_1 /TAXON_ID=1118495 /ORGANISM="Dactyliosolen fragilissimus" /LENGTH=166 /DNA_ID=CAMNT_0027358929 /DNA_START=238 /DNA_END=738 /DNA_ORIENTATION=+
MPGWFDLYDWPIGVGSKDDPEGLDKAVRAIESTAEELENKGIPRNKIVVGGFSQGGAVALLAAYHPKYRGGYGGCAALSGWLTLPDELKDLDEKTKQTPLFWGHGEYDDKVLFEQQKFGVNRLKDSGVQTDSENSSYTIKSYPMGHMSHPDELDDFSKFLEHIFSM